MSHLLSYRPSLSSLISDNFAANQPHSLSADRTLPHPMHPESELVRLQTKHGKMSSLVAHQYNLMASYQRRGVFFVSNSNGFFQYHGASNPDKALEFHKEALKIFHYSRLNALSGGRYVEARELAVEMASTLSDVGNTLLEVNAIAKSAVAFRECINLFLEGLTDEGQKLRQKFDEVEDLFKKNQNCIDESGSRSIFDQESYFEECFVLAEKLMHGFDHQGIAKVLAAHPSYRTAVHGILDLLRKMPSPTILSMETSSDNKWRHRAILSRRDSLLSLDDILCDSATFRNEYTHSSSMSSLACTLATMTSSACSSSHGFTPSQTTMPIQKLSICTKKECASVRANEDSDDLSLLSVEFQIEDRCCYSLARIFEMLEVNAVSSLSASSTAIGDDNIMSDTCNQTTESDLGQLMHLGKSLRFIMHCIPNVVSPSNTCQI